jgi:aspartyl protease family protein
MGHIEIKVGISRHEGKKIHEAKALVDTGSTFTVIPEGVARELNLKLLGEKVKASTAKGPDELDLAHALLEINGKRRILPVLVSKHVDRVRLGVITLEAMQLRVNPLTEELEEYTAFLY